MARKMKDSGLKWVGQIPAPWEVSRLKYLVSCNNNALSDETDPDFEFDYVDIGSVENGKGIVQTKRVRFHDASPRARRVVHSGDVIISTVRTYLRAVAAITDEFSHVIVSTGFAVLRPKNVSPQFLKYLIAADYFIANVQLKSKGINYPCINTVDLLDLSCILPPLPEQRLIAARLDEVTGKVERAATKIKTEIERLEAYKKSVICEAVCGRIDLSHGERGEHGECRPMKDSGIPWVGKIPQGWEVSKGKYILRLLNRPIREDDGVITCFRDGEVTLRSKRRESGFTISLKECGYQGIEPGDLVVHGMDGFAGSIGISDSRGKATPVLNVLDATQDKKYLMYYLRALAYRNVFVALATGIRVRSCDLRWNKLADLMYTLPPLPEQHLIAAHIDKVCAKVDDVIGKRTKQLEKLDALKRSLVYEYVTGKKEVLNA